MRRRFSIELSSRYRINHLESTLSLAAYHQEQGTDLIDVGPSRVPAQFGDLRGEYDAATEGAGLHDRSYRGLIKITGGDRAAWLHNLTTNDIKSIKLGCGLYSFSLNIKGRVLFDGNVLALPDALLLDVDCRWIGPAIEHLVKYIVMEDVQLADRSADFERLALVGPKASEVCERAGSVPSDEGIAQAEACGSLTLGESLRHAEVRIGDVACRVVRHDFAGPASLELIVPAPNALEVWEHLLHIGESAGLRPVGLDALQVLRVEAGLPWSLEDIDAKVLPAETRQIERAVSFTKGCYLGQEIVERMRSRGAPANLLVGLAFDGGEVCTGASLTHDGQTVGRVTSAVRSFKVDCRIGLGYVKSDLAESGTQLLAVGDDSETICQTCEIPFN